MTDAETFAADETSQHVDRVLPTSVLLIATIKQLSMGVALTHKIRDLASGGVRTDQGETLRKGATVAITLGLLEAGQQQLFGLPRAGPRYSSQKRSFRIKLAPERS